MQIEEGGTLSRISAGHILGAHWKKEMVKRNRKWNRRQGKKSMDPRGRENHADEKRKSQTRPTELADERSYVLAHRDTEKILNQKGQNQRENAGRAIGARKYRTRKISGDAAGSQGRTA